MSPDDLPYRDPTLPVETRVADLLARMTLAERAAQIACPFGSAVDVHDPPPTGWGSATAALSTLDLPPRAAAAAGNELQRKHVEDTRLGIPILLAEEALVGFKVRDATAFPDAIAQAATWDPELIERMAAAIGRQMALVGVRQALAPLADVARDPRWGRVEETYGEEPFLVGAMATAFVRGLQGADAAVPLIATLKHFVGYGASDGGRNTEAAAVGPNELREFFAVPFETAIREGGARAVMPAYNALDGVPVTGSAFHLTHLLRAEYGFDGLVISDLAAIGQLHTKHGTAPDAAGALAQALRAGVDLDLDNRVSSDLIVEAVGTGVLAEAELDRAVAAVLRAKFQIGLFERPYAEPAAVPDTLDSAADRLLARTVAERSVVLLRNEPVTGAPLLPLDGSPRTIAVIGPNAHRPMGQLGNYSYQVLDSTTRRFALAADPQADLGVAGTLDTGDAEALVESVPVVTFLDGIRNRAGAGSTIVYEPGCRVGGGDRSGIAAAVHAATEADLVVLVLGDQAGIAAFGTVGEGIDSAHCELPGIQRELAEAVAATGTPVVAVLSHGRPYALGWLRSAIPAIVTTFFGGEEAGTALASVLFGDVDPGGRLPISFLEHPAAAPLPYWRTLRPGSYYDGSTAAVFPFGHGLSYTTTDYRAATVDTERVPTDGTVTLSVLVANTGSRPGAEVVQIYGQDPVARTVRRGRVLVAFRRLSLAPGEVKRVTAQIPAELFALWDGTEWVVEPGAVRFHIGRSAADTPLMASVTLTGPEHRPGPARRLTSSTGVETVDPSTLEAEEAAAPAHPAGPLRPVTADDTVRDWLDHPVGGDLLRATLEGASEEVLAPAFGVTMRQLVAYSQGRFPRELLDDLVAGVERACASQP